MPPLPAPDAPFDTLALPLRQAPGRYAVTFPDGWQQGRGTFGGLVLAAAVRALEDAVEPGRTLRSLTAEICGPTLPGEPELAVEILRAGNNVTTAAVRLVQGGGEVLAHAVGVLGAARSRDRDRVTLAPPEIPDWRGLEPLPVAPPLGPDFGRFFDFRSSGPLPFSGAAEAYAEGFIHPKVPGTRRDPAYLVACADAFWPAAWSQEQAPRPMATIAFALEVCGSLDGLDPEAPLFYRARTAAVRDGYIVEFRELWGVDGRLLALNQQTIAIIK